MHIFDVVEGPGEKVSSSDAFHPGGLGGEICRSMKVSCGLLSAGEHVYVVGCLLLVRAAKRLNVFGHCSQSGDLVEGIH